jgi:hypothetical protein
MRGEEHCELCGRSILAGERVHGFISEEDRRTVCELCVDAAERYGWRREGAPEPELPEPSSRRRRAGLGSLLRRRARRPDPVPRPAPAPEEEGEEEMAEAREPAPAAEESPAPRARVAPPPLEPSALSPFERATARFNVSEAARTVAGLARTLGSPWVSVGASAGTPSEIRITVAWELSWYQWGVDLGDETRPVFQLDKGLEMSQLDAAARQWNASAIEAGRIVLGAPARGEAPGEPARR